MPENVPRTTRWIPRFAASSEDRQAVLDDVAEEAAALADAAGHGAARRWSRQQALRSIAPLLRRRVEIAIKRMRTTSMNGWRGFGFDLTTAVRRLRQAPGFTAVCVLTLALGIGGNTAVFTLVDRVLLKPLPVPRPSELYRVGDTDACCVNSGYQGSFSLFSYDHGRAGRTGVDVCPPTG